MDVARARSAAWWVLSVAGVLVACVTALVASGGAPLDVPGASGEAVVGWGVRLVRALGWTAAAVTVGSLLVAAGLTDHAEPRRRGLRAARPAGLVWAVCGVLGYLLGVHEVAGVVSAAAAGAGQESAWWSRAATSHLVSAAMAATVALAVRQADPARRARVLLALGLAAALPVPLAGHVSLAGDGGVPAGALAVHVVAALLWIGGLAGLLLHLRRDQGALVQALPRYSALALVAYLALGGSGLVAASASLPFTGTTWQAAWASGYGIVVLVKLGLLTVLGAVGAGHRMWTLPRLLSGRPREFLRLAAAEVCLMAVAGGAAAALPFASSPPAEADAHAAGGVERLSWSSVLLAWRPDVVVLSVVGLGVMAYLRARRRWAGTSRTWPTRRTCSFVAGAGLAVVLTCSGVATYAPVMLSMHLAQLLGMLLVVPALVGLGRPWLLARAAGRARPAPSTVLTPGIVSGATCVLLLGVYGTPLLDLTLRSSWAHLVVLTCAGACGLLATAVWLGDRADAAVGRAATGPWLLPPAACLGVLGWRMRQGDQLLAAEWFLELRLGWVDPVADQRLAGGLALVVAAALAALALSGSWRGARAAHAPTPVRRGAPQPLAPSSAGPGQSRRSTRPSRSSTGTAP